MDERTRALRDPRRVVSTLIWTGLVLSAAVLASRRFAGSFSLELSPSVSVAAVTLALAAGLAALALFLSARPTAGSTLGTRAAAAATLTAPLLFGAALIGSGSPFVWAWLLTSIAIAAPVVMILISERTASPGRHDSQHNDVPSPSADVSTRLAAHIPDTVESSTETLFDDPDVSQWLTRRQLPNGGEQIEGSVKLFFAAGRKQTVAHVAFVPPLAGPPEIECEPLDDAAVRVKATAQQTFGLRIEGVRTSGVEDAAVVPVGFFVSTAVRVTEAA